MKTKLVLWGKNAQDERILTAIELKAKENKVGTYVFTKEMSTDDFAQTLMNEWRLDKDVTLPDAHEYSERELSISDNMIPDAITVERDDLLKRAQTEWHFVVLSAKMHRIYNTELQELQEEIEKLDRFDSELWDKLKLFWDKVQEQVRDRNLFREHADSLRNNTNALFSRLKELRADLEKEFKKRSSDNVQKYMNMLEDVEKRIEEEKRLSSIFEELKGIQRKFRDVKFTREDRSKVWNRLDAAFKTVKEKRFGKKAAENNSPLDRLSRRQDGLTKAIERMERSIERDNDDLKFQRRKIETTDGQLEAQIREAKIKMIEERINSKKERLEDMHKTMEKIESRMESQKKREEQRKKQAEIEAAKKAAKEKIEQEMKEAEEARQESAEKLEKAAKTISGKAEEPAAEAKKEERPKADKSDDTLSEAVRITLGETLEDAVDTVKAVAKVVGEKVQEYVTETVQELQEELAEKGEAVTTEEKSDEKEE